MPMRAPKQSVGVTRDGQRVYPDIGKPFDFTEQELADIMAANPDAISSEAMVDLKADEPVARATGKAAKGKAGASEETL